MPPSRPISWIPGRRRAFSLEVGGPLASEHRDVDVGRGLQKPPATVVPRHPPGPSLRHESPILSQGEKWQADALGRDCDLCFHLKGLRRSPSLNERSRFSSESSCRLYRVFSHSPNVPPSPGHHAAGISDGRVDRGDSIGRSGSAVQQSARHDSRQDRCGPACRGSQLPSSTGDHDIAAGDGDFYRQSPGLRVVGC